MLADEHTDTDAGHVETVEEGLDGAVDLHALAATLVLENALRHRGNDAIVTALNVVQSLSKALVVEVKIGGPVACVVDNSKVPARKALVLAIAVLKTAPAVGLALVNGRIWSCCRKAESVATESFAGFHETTAYIRG